MTQTLFIFDVESVGLYGTGFAVAVVIYDRGTKTVLEKQYFACSPQDAAGLLEDHQWINQHVVPFLPQPNLTSVAEVRQAFWELYFKSKTTYPDVSTWADCGYPVEARFLQACVCDRGNNERTWQAPYPLQEIATVRTILGLDSTLAYDLSEDKRHNPLEECLYIAPKLANWLDDLRPAQRERPV